MSLSPTNLPDPHSQASLRQEFGDIDIYAFDALLQGYWKPPMRFLDAGCGTGRNLPYFLRHGFVVSALDADEDALDVARELAFGLDPSLPESRFRAENLENNTFAEASFDAVLCNAVLHFARDRDHFQSMLAGLWRVLAPRGTAMIRLGCRIGLEGKVQDLGGGRYRQPDGAEWYLPDAEELHAWEQSLGARRWKPLKASWVDGRRSMATWWLHKL